MDATGESRSQGPEENLLVSVVGVGVCNVEVHETQRSLFRGRALEASACMGEVVLSVKAAVTLPMVRFGSDESCRVSYGQRRRSMWSPSLVDEHAGSSEVACEGMGGGKL